MRDVRFPLWPLALLAALLPAIAAHVAYVISVGEGHVPACIPYWDGCTSISRAARHGLGNIVFRALVLPAALLQFLFWWASRGWLQRTGQQRGASLPWIGGIACLFLILYASFLGTEGDVYRFLRRYGALSYFAGTYLCLLVLLRAWPHQAEDWLVRRGLAAVALGQLVLGMGYNAAAGLVADPLLKDRLENVLEWQLGVLLTAGFLFVAWRWRRDRLVLALHP